MPATDAPGATGIVAIRVASKRRRRIQASLAKWRTDHYRDYPWRDPGRSPYEILIAEHLLKRTTSTAASRVYRDFITRFPSIRALYRADQTDIEESLRSIGLQSQRARGFKELARHVVEASDGNLPRDRRQLEGLPHVGPYAAAAICSFALDEPAAIVDSNVARIIQRVFGDSLPSPTPPKLLQALADELLPLEDHRAFNLALLDLGALVCRYTRPKCSTCPVVTCCDFGRHSGSQSEVGGSRATGAPP
jgi:A/G-specific adenine glycosylase